MDFIRLYINTAQIYLINLDDKNKYSENVEMFHDNYLQRFFNRHKQLKPS